MKLETLKWLATAILIVGTAVNGLGFYPLGPIMLVLGGIIWLIVAVKVQDRPLIVTNLVMSLVGIITIAITMYSIAINTPPEGGGVKPADYDPGYTECQK